MHTLIYTSYSLEDMKKEQLIDLLVQSREKNKKIDVTGMLVYYKRVFVQILEGRKEDIFFLFDRIGKDDRHTSIHLFYDTPIEKRSFYEWTMGFCDLNQIEADLLPGFTNMLEEGFSTEITNNKLSESQEIFESIVHSFLKLPQQYEQLACDHSRG